MTTKTSGSVTRGSAATTDQPYFVRADFVTMGLFSLISRRGFCKAISKVKKMNNISPTLDRYVWMDLEMTGLDVNKDKILEIACIITTTDLNPVDENINLVIHQPDDVLNSMNDWCVAHHGKTGLTQASRESNISVTEADKLVSDYIKKYTDCKGTRYLTGNSVHQDRIFIDKYMPSISSLLHYRIVDVSTVKILCSHWYHEDYLKLPKKRFKHRAIDDIWDSINELKSYQKAIFKS